MATANRMLVIDFSNFFLIIVYININLDNFLQLQMGVFIIDF